MHCMGLMWTPCSRDLDLVSLFAPARCLEYFSLLTLSACQCCDHAEIRALCDGSRSKRSRGMLCTALLCSSVKSFTKLVSPEIGMPEGAPPGLWKAEKLYGVQPQPRYNPVVICPVSPHCAPLLWRQSDGSWCPLE